MSSFEHLATFHAIAWDFDETLIDSPASKALQHFIIANPDIDHYIVTFRTHGMVPAIPFDLARYKDAPPIEVFKKIITVPEKYWLDNRVIQHERRFNGYEGPLTDAEILYKTWKGSACKEHSIHVLVDDNSVDTKLGCEKYSIVLVDPLDLI